MKKIIMSITCLVVVNFSFAQVRTNFDIKIINVDEIIEAIVVYDKNAEQVVDTIFLGKNIFQEIIHSHVVSLNNLSFIVTSDNDVIYWWLKKKNGKWKIINEYEIDISMNVYSRRQREEYENGGKSPIPIAYYITKVNQLILVYKTKIGGHIQEVIDFEDEG